MTFSHGQKLGAYRIIRLLGEGGMGVVYEVEHEQLGVRYALKAFSPPEKNAELLRSKFLTEGKVMARMNDPHLIRVFDLAIDDETGVPYFVMDLITSKDGSPRTLDEIDLDDLEESRILTWFDDLCCALDYIHAQGVVHRDIKTGNVLLRADGHVMLSDFGVSRIFGVGLSREVSAMQTVVSDGTTGLKLVMGTDGYMAPEVLEGCEATPAADVYSLGVLFFHLLTGLWYERGARSLRLLDNFQNRWQDVLPRMLAVDPRQRPLPLSDLPRQLRRRQRWWLIGLGIIVLAAVATAAWMIWQPSGGTTKITNEQLHRMFSSDDIFNFPNGRQ